VVTATESPTATGTATLTVTVTATPSAQSTASDTATATDTATASPSATPTQPVCVGDCNHNLAVTVDELLRGVRISLGEGPLSLCPAMDRNGSGEVTVDELVTAVDNALTGCPPQ